MSGAIIFAKTSDGTYQVPRLDAISHAMETIDFGHHEIHDGTAYTAYYTLTTAATDGHRTGLYLRTPSDGRRVHVVASFSASTAARYSICESPTIAANIGTHAQPIYNRDRDSGRVSGCLDNAASPAVGKYTTLTEAQIAGDVTWATGTVIRSEPLRVGDAPKPAGGAGRDAQEYILKADTGYVFLVTNTAGSANTHYILVDWYEQTPRTA